MGNVLYMWRYKPQVESHSDLMLILPKFCFYCLTSIKMAKAADFLQDRAFLPTLLGPDCHEKYIYVFMDSQVLVWNR